MTDELKPVRCGCGGEVWAFMTLYPDNRERPYICQCRRCFTRTGGYPTEAEAIEAWNRAMGEHVFECVDGIHTEKRDASSRVERKTGKWLEPDVFDVKKQVDKLQCAKCSVCGKWHTTPFLYYFDNYPYCPNCGADMRGE